MILWDFITHKVQGKTIDSEVIDLVKSDKFCGVNLVAISRVRKL